MRSFTVWAQSNGLVSFETKVSWFRPGRSGPRNSKAPGNLPSNPGRLPRVLPTRFRFLGPGLPGFKARKGSTSPDSENEVLGEAHGTDIDLTAPRRLVFRMGASAGSIRAARPRQGFSIGFAEGVGQKFKIRTFRCPGAYKNNTDHATLGHTSHPYN